MERLKGICASILALLFGLGEAAEVHEDIKSQQLDCATPIPTEPTVQACLEHELAKAHLPPDEDVGKPPTEEMPRPLRTAAANLLASENPPRRHDFVQPDQQARNHALYDLPSKPTKPDGEPPPEHIEPPSPESAIADPGSLAAQMGGRSTASATLGSYVSTAPQFFENPAPVFSPAQRGSLVVVLTPPSGNQVDQKELKATKPEPSEPPHYEPKQELPPATVAADDGARLSDWFGPSLSGPRPNFRAGPLGSA
jgi:hypothetical protein